MSDLLIETLSGYLSYWWVVVPVIAYILGKDWWLAHITDEHIDAIEWIMWEISIPKDNLKSIKAMEQVITSLHGIYSFGILKKDKWLKGVIEPWISLEMVGMAKGVHFYVRAPKKFKNLVEASFFAQFPDAELLQVEDYTSLIKTKTFANYDIFGTDFVLAEKDYLPIKTYEYFEDMKEEKTFDPLATLTEVMAGLKEDEMIWIQILLRATGDDWRKGAEIAIKEIMGEKVQKPKSSLDIVKEELLHLVKNVPRGVIPAPFEAPKMSGLSSEEKKDLKSNSSPRTPGDTDKMKAISNKMSKKAFNTLIRFIYIDDKDNFSGENTTAVMGALRQFGDANLNSLRPNMNTMTLKPRRSFNKKKVLAKKKRNLMIAYIERAMPRYVKNPEIDLNLKTSILGADEVATIFHPPTDYVKSEKVKAIQSRKGNPPTNLPTFES